MMANLYKYKYFYATKMSFVNKEDIEVKNIKRWKYFRNDICF